MTRGKPKVAVGIIHPIESYWSYWGNQKQTATIRQKLEAEFENIIRWMLYGLIDFDFISEAVLGDTASGPRSIYNGRNEISGNCGSRLFYIAGKYL